MKKTITFLLASVMGLSMMPTNVSAQNESPKNIIFKGVQRLDSKKGFAYDFDANDQLKSTTYFNPKGEKTRVDSIFWKDGRIYRVDQYYSSDQVPPVPLPLYLRFEYTYDKDNRLSERLTYESYDLKNVSGKKEFIYDENGNVVILRTHLLGIGKTVDLRYIYNDKNQLVKSGYPSDDDPDFLTSFIRTYEYDEDGRIIKESSFTEEPNSVCNGYTSYKYDGDNLTSMEMTDVSEETKKESLYLKVNLRYDNAHKGNEVKWSDYPYSLDGAMFQTSIISDAIEDGDLRTFMDVIDPDVSMDKPSMVFAYLYQFPSSIKEVMNTNTDIKVYINDSRLTVEGNDLVEVYLYDMNGQVLFNLYQNADRVELPVSNLHQGTYLVVAKDKNGQVKTAKIIF